MTTKIGFRLAVERGIISTNTLEKSGLRPEKSMKKDKVVKALTEDEQRKLVNALESHVPPNGRNSYRLQLLIALYAGLRMGEINALTEDSIDLNKGVIHVTRTISRGIRSVPFLKDGTKTDAGSRDVPISSTLRPILEETLRQKKNNPYNLLFYDYIKGGLVETHQVNSFFRRICVKAEIPYYGQHCLRHTFATRCIEADVPPVVLKTWLGHSNIHITLDTYADVYNRMNFGAIDKFTEHMENVMDMKNQE